MSLHPGDEALAEQRMQTIKEAQRMAHELAEIDRYLGTDNWMVQKFGNPAMDRPRLIAAILTTLEEAYEVAEAYAAEMRTHAGKEWAKTDWCLDVIEAPGGEDGTHCGRCAGCKFAETFVHFNSSIHHGGSS